MANKKQEIARVELKSDLSKWTVGDFKALGISMEPDATAARKKLVADGIANSKYSDNAVILMSVARDELKKSDDFKTSAAMRIGILRYSGELGSDPKDVNANLAKIFPEWKASTIRTYALVGQKIALPIAAQDKEFDSLAKLGDLSTSVLKEITGIIDKPDAKKYIADKINATDKPITSRVLAQIRKDYETEHADKDDKNKGKIKDKNKDNASEHNAYKSEFDKAFIISAMDGELSIEVHAGDVVKALEIIADATKDKDSAFLFVHMLSEQIKSVKAELNLQ